MVVNLRLWVKKFLKHEHTYDMFDPKEAKQAAGSLVGETCLWYAKWEGDNTKIRISKRAHDLMVMTQQMLGDSIFLVCDQCRREKGFKTITDEKQDDLDWDALSKFATIYEVCVDPVITQQAQKELEAVN